MKVIDQFCDTHRFLSNFYPVEIKYDGIIYPSVEQAYQAAKTDDKKEKELIAQNKNPGKAKKYGSKLLLSESWENTKSSIMLDLLRIKFSNRQLKKTFACNR